MNEKQDVKKGTTINFEVIPHEQAVAQRRKMESDAFKLKQVRLPKADLNEAKRALERIPITNKMYVRVQEEEQVLKKKKQLEEEAKRIQILQQQRQQENDSFEL